MRIFDSRDMREARTDKAARRRTTHALAPQTYGAREWKKISKLMHDKFTDVQCLHRWSKVAQAVVGPPAISASFRTPLTEVPWGPQVLRPGLRKGPWSEQEDKIVFDIVNQNGVENVKWAQVADHLPGRIGKQCRERWHNHLDPKISKDEVPIPPCSPTPTEKANLAPKLTMIRRDELSWAVRQWTDAEDRALFEAHQELGNKWSNVRVFPRGSTVHALSTTRRKAPSRLAS